MLRGIYDLRFTGLGIVKMAGLAYLARQFTTGLGMPNPAGVKYLSPLLEIGRKRVLLARLDFLHLGVIGIEAN